MTITTENQPVSTGSRPAARPARRRVAFAAAAGVIAATIATVGAAGLVTGERATAGGATVREHPALPCNLSEEAVANWGETSAHLPQACTYDE